MKPMGVIEEVETLSQVLASKLLPSPMKWNLGVDVLVYRDGNDKIGWHADDNQGETKIFAVVIESNISRQVLFKRKVNNKLEIQYGDEYIKLYPSEGDSYEMDGKMQENYLHSVTNNTYKGNIRRIYLIFRQGKESPFKSDTGVPVDDLLPKKK